MLIREPDVRWPLYLLAAIITAAVVLVTVGVMRTALTWEVEKHIPGLPHRGLIRQGSPEFERLREKVVVDQPVAGESTLSPDGSAIEVGATVRNTTGRTISGLEVRAGVLDSQHLSVSERTVLIIVPARQTVIEPGEAISVRVLLEGVGPITERMNPLMEVTGVGFD
jgi:hypothetical protein